MGDNGVRRYMVSLNETIAVADQHGVGKHNVSYDALSAFLEEGMNKVLREVACTRLQYEVEHVGAGYEKNQAQSDKVEELFAQLKEVLPEELMDQLMELQSQVGYLDLHALDAGYVAGFLAGYRFLAELNLK